MLPLWSMMNRKFDGLSCPRIEALTHPASIPMMFVIVALPASDCAAKCEVGSGVLVSKRGLPPWHANAVTMHAAKMDARYFGRGTNE
jgi:hypothetical protein